MSIDVRCSPFIKSRTLPAMMIWWRLGLELCQLLVLLALWGEVLLGFLTDVCSAPLRVLHIITRNYSSHMVVLRTLSTVKFALLLDYFWQSHQY